MHYFLVYNDNTHGYFLQSLLQSVQKYGPEFKIIVFHKDQMDKEFVEKHKSILSLKRGGGYWLWKPYIINTVLKQLNEGDILFYSDSKYYFKEPFTGLYADYLKDHDFLLWKNHPNEPCFYMKNWCKMDVILAHNMYSKVFIDNVNDCWAGAMVIKKTANTTKYIQEWLDLACVYENITDSPSVIRNSSDFVEHRHDQSMLSVVVYKYGIPLHFFERKYLQNARFPY
jgi:hypothetical protein